MQEEIRVVPATFVLFITLTIWFIIPVPSGITPEAWHLLALFIGTISAIIAKVMPIGAIAIIAITLVALTGVTNPDPKLAIKDALSGFSNPLIWLIGTAIIISRSLVKTGLGHRIGYYFISLFGKKTIGIGYSLAVSEFVIAPITPSNTARGGGIIHPIMKSIASNFESPYENKSDNKTAKYLALSTYHINPITSAMFITATAPNPLIVKFIADATGANISITWAEWAFAMLLPGLVAMTLIPLVVYMFFPPDVKETPDAPKIAKEKLKEMGKMDKDEKITISVFGLLLFLWAGVPSMLFGDSFSLNATSVAFLGLSILLITNVLSWNDVVNEKSAWETITWFAALVMMAAFLNKLGLINWFSTVIETSISSMNIGWELSVFFLVIVYFYAHYFFASTTAHITAMFGAFYAAGLALGAPPYFLAFILAATSSLMMSLTHYATGTSPIVYGSGFVTLKEWWKMGFIVSVVTLSVWTFIGGVWWSVLGYW